MTLITIDDDDDDSLLLPRGHVTLITIEGSKVIEEIERCTPLTTMPARYLAGN